MRPPDQPHGVCFIDPVSIAALADVGATIFGSTAATGAAAATAGAADAAATAGGASLLGGLGTAAASAGAGLGAAALLNKGQSPNVSIAAPSIPAPPPPTNSPQARSNTPSGSQPTFLGAAATPQPTQSGQKSLLGQ